MAQQFVTQIFRNQQNVNQDNLNYVYEDKDQKISAYFSMPVQNTNNIYPGVICSGIGNINQSFGFNQTNNTFALAKGVLRFPDVTSNQAPYNVTNQTNLISVFVAFDNYTLTLPTGLTAGTYYAIATYQVNNDVTNIRFSYSPTNPPYSIIATSTFTPALSAMNVALFKFTLAVSGTTYTISNIITDINCCANYDPTTNRQSAYIGGDVSGAYNYNQNRIYPINSVIYCNQPCFTRQLPIVIDFTTYSTNYNNGVFQSDGRQGVTIYRGGYSIQSYISRPIILDTASTTYANSSIPYTLNQQYHADGYANCFYVVTTLQNPTSSQAYKILITQDFITYGEPQYNTAVLPLPTGTTPVYNTIAVYNAVVYFVTGSGTGGGNQLYLYTYNTTTSPSPTSWTITQIQGFGSPINVSFSTTDAVVFGGKLGAPAIPIYSIFYCLPTAPNTMVTITNTGAYDNFKKLNHDPSIFVLYNGHNGSTNNYTNFLINNGAITNSLVSITPPAMSGKTVQYVLDVSYYNNKVLCLSVMTDNSFQLIGTSYPMNAQSTWTDYSFVIPNGATYTLGTANITPNWMYPIGNYLYIQLSATTVGYNLIVTNLSNYVGMAKSLVNNNSTSPNDSQNFLNGNWTDVYDVRLN